MVINGSYDLGFRAYSQRAEYGNCFLASQDYGLRFGCELVSAKFIRASVSCRGVLGRIFNVDQNSFSS